MSSDIIINFILASNYLGKAPKNHFFHHAKKIWQACQKNCTIFALTLKSEEEKSWQKSLSKTYGADWWKITWSITLKIINTFLIVYFHITKEYIFSWKKYVFSSVHSFYCKICHCIHKFYIDLLVHMKYFSLLLFLIVFRENMSDFLGSIRRSTELIQFYQNLSLKINLPIYIFIYICQDLYVSDVTFSTTIYYENKSEFTKGLTNIFDREYHFSQ